VAAGTKHMRALLERASKIVRDIDERQAGLQAEQAHLTRERAKVSGQIELLEHLLAPAAEAPAE
jgi:hypothetical protein